MNNTISSLFWTIYRKNQDSWNAGKRGFISDAKNYMHDWCELGRWITWNANFESFIETFGEKYASFVKSWLDTHAPKFVGGGVKVIKVENNLKRIYDNEKHLLEVNGINSDLPKFAL